MCSSNIGLFLAKLVQLILTACTNGQRPSNTACCQAKSQNCNIQDVWWLQTDVVETQSCLFNQRMAAVDTLGAAQRAHALFIDTVTAHAFLDEPKVMEAVSGVLAQCRALVSSVQVWSPGLETEPHALSSMVQVCQSLALSVAGLSVCNAVSSLRRSLGRIT